MSGGRLRHRLDILRPVQVKDGSGYATIWDRCVTGVPAEVLSLDGREAFVDRVLTGIRSFRITMRWRGDVQPKDQLKYAGIDLNLRSAEDPDGRRQWLVITADTESALRTD